MTDNPNDSLMEFVFGRSVRDLQSRVETLYDGLPTEEEFNNLDEEGQDNSAKQAVAIHALLEEWVIDPEEREKFNPF